MKLHEAIKQLVTQFGESVVTEVRLANLLADLNGYQDYPAMKTVFKEVLKAGYGQDFYSAYKTNPQKALNEEFSLIKKIATETRFKEDLISYSLDCILFAIGGITIINEPFSKGFDPYSSGPSDVLNNLSSQLSALKKQYIDMLDRLPTLPNGPSDVLNNLSSQLSALKKQYIDMLDRLPTLPNNAGLSDKVKFLLEGGELNGTKIHIPYWVCPIEIRYAMQCLEPCSQLYHHDSNTVWSRMDNMVFKNSYEQFFKEMAYNAFFLTMRWYYHFMLNEKNSPSNGIYSNKHKQYYY